MCTVQCIKSIILKAHSLLYISKCVQCTLCDGLQLHAVSVTERAGQSGTQQLQSLNK